MTGSLPSLRLTVTRGHALRHELTHGLLHYRLLALLGMTIGEFWCLDDLAADCADDGVYEGLLMSAPSNRTGGSGSPANALAIK